MNHPPTPLSEDVLKAMADYAIEQAEIVESYIPLIDKAIINTLPEEERRRSRRNIREQRHRLLEYVAEHNEPEALLRPILHYFQILINETYKVQALLARKRRQDDKAGSKEELNTKRQRVDLGDLK